MPGPQPDPVTTSRALPEHVDVAILGGGIAGVCAALELVERGRSVAIFEKGQIAAEQSSRNWGWVRLTHRDPRELPLMIEAVRLWETMDTRIGADTGYRQCGATYAVTSKAALAEETRAANELQRHGIPARVLDREALLAAFPGLSGDYLGALHNPQDGRGEPQQATPAIARAVQARGGSVHQACAVRSVETTDGRVSGVITEKGAVSCSAVLVAGGAWSRLFLGNLGIALPQLRTKGNVMRSAPVAQGPEGTLKHPGFAMRKRLDGGYTIASASPSRYQLTPDSFRLLRAFLPTLKHEWRSIRLGFGPAFFEALTTPRRWRDTDVTPFEKTRVLDPSPDRATIDAVFDLVRKTYAPFRSATPVQRWAGYIDVLPDVIPVISPTQGVKNGLPGLFVATGFSGHGFGLGPGAGLLAADLITGSAPCVDPAPFRLHRFSDGSPITPMSGIIQR